MSLFVMNSDVMDALEKGLIHIGNQISSWRDDKSAREIVEPKAFKTNADMKAHFLICDLIHKYFPDHTVLSEEDYVESEKRPSIYWLIDPIDGTASWYDGFAGFVTQIALIENNKPIYGAVYAPVLEKLWTAHLGFGAKLNGTILPQLKPVDRLNLIDNYPEPQRVAKKIAENMPVTNYIECGSLGLKSCMVVDGTADLFIKDVVIRDWDIAPISVMINEVGGVMADIDGKEILFCGSYENNGIIVACSRELSEQALNVSKT